MLALAAHALAEVFAFLYVTLLIVPIVKNADIFFGQVLLPDFIFCVMTCRDRINVSRKICGRSLLFLLLLGDPVLINATGKRVVTLSLSLSLSLLLKTWI